MGQIQLDKGLGAGNSHLRVAWSLNKRGLQHTLHTYARGRTCVGLLSTTLLCLWNATAAHAQYVQRQVVTSNGADQLPSATPSASTSEETNDEPGTSGSIGTFITTNTNLRDNFAWPPGTTEDWRQNSSAAVLNLPPNSRVVYAELDLSMRGAGRSWPPADQGDPDPLHPRGPGGSDAGFGILEHQAVCRSDAELAGSGEEGLGIGLAPRVVFSADEHGK